MARTARTVHDDLDAEMHQHRISHLFADDHHYAVERGGRQGVLVVSREGGRVCAPFAEVVLLSTGLAEFSWQEKGESRRNAFPL